ncbi:hypothetical protein AB0892_19845 [Streptomyces sp. NPDC005409]|uniref:hypothetical protein n=1 Tax=Streptomyces sp. NPDC005409 TaxID=3155342 RepID=UPI0034563AF3
MDYELERSLVTLEEIATGARELRAVRHPLGFLCLPLLREGPRGVCVHLFETDHRPEPDASPLHCHSWELRSRVLYGRVANLPVHTTVVADGEAGATHRVFEVRSRSDGVDEIQPTSLLVRSEIGPAHVTSGGESYTLAAGQFHATALTGEAPAATLVHGFSIPGQVDLSLGPLDGRPRRTTRRLCDTGQSVRSAHTVLRRIDAQQRA